MVFHSAKFKATADYKFNKAIILRFVSGMVEIFLENGKKIIKKVILAEAETESDILFSRPVCYRLSYGDLSMLEKLNMLVTKISSFLGLCIERLGAYCITVVSLSVHPSVCLCKLTMKT